jgi:hypothetical protein
VVSNACNVDRPTEFIQVIFVLGPLPAIGMAGRNAWLLRVVPTTNVTHGIAALVGEVPTAAHEFIDGEPL